MPNTLVQVDIEKDNTLRDVEQYIKLLNDTVTQVNIKLPRKHRMTLFKDSWITSLISTASHGRLLHITDWDSMNNQEEIRNRFSQSLIGITSAFMATQISNVRKEKYDLNIHEIVEHIVYDQNGVIEDSESGKSWVFCSFDSDHKEENFPRPFALSFENKEDFIKKFLDFKRDKIDTLGLGSMGTLPFAFDEEWDLPSLIFELYENTNQHGKYDENNQIIKGVRSFSIRKHVSYDYKKLLEQANEFEELQTYIESHSKKGLRFYEISISDNGMGIVERLRSQRPELLQGVGFEQMTACEQLNYIISKTLSSKLYPGSGLGLTMALRNLAKLKGFMSLRTGNQWVYFDGINHSNQSSLLPAKNTESLSRITGTHYNILIPAT